MHHTRHARAALGAMALALSVGFLGSAAQAQVLAQDAQDAAPPQTLPPSTPPAPGQGLFPQALLPAPDPADAPPPTLTPLAPRDPAEFNNADRPLLSFGTDSYYVKPILAIAGGIWAELIQASINAGKESRVTTMAITRFGFEGRLGPYVSFRSEFERNIGRHGSGVWEGTASLNSRDNYIRLSRWGVIIDGGIILDEASVDFFSAHMADLLLADKYARDPLLYAGFNRGQGLKVSYGRWGLRLGFAYTEANPLSTSTSFQIGGSFAGGSRFYEKPLGNFRIGQPDDDFHFRVLSPSLTYAHRFFELRAVGQLFTINYQTNSKDDPNLWGYNVKGSGIIKLRGRIPTPYGGVRFSVTPFGNFALVRNDVLNNNAADKLLATQYQAMTYSAGVDFFIKDRSGFGFNFAEVRDRSPSITPDTGVERTTLTIQTYVNAGATYWLTEYVAWGLRCAYYRKRQDMQPDEADLSLYTTIRLVI